MKTDYQKGMDKVREDMRQTPEGKLLLAYDFEPFDTESSARRVSEKAAVDIKVLADALNAAHEQLEYCGYGDSWERMGTESLAKQIAEGLALAEQRIGWKNPHETNI